MTVSKRVRRPNDHCKKIQALVPADVAGVNQLESVGMTDLQAVYGRDMAPTVSALLTNVAAVILIWATARRER
jgi:hypothetical protein